MIRRFRVERIGNTLFKDELPTLKYVDVSDEDVNDIFNSGEIVEYIVNSLIEGISEYKKPLVKYYIKITEI